MERPQVPALRVLLVCEWFVKYTTGLARGLLDLGTEVVLLTRDHDLEFGGEPGAMQGFVADSLGEDVPHLEIGGRVRDPRRAGDVLRLRGWCRRWGPDVVHVQDSLTHDMRLAVAAGFPRRGYALTVHDPTPHPGDAQPSARTTFVRRELRRHAKLLFAHSTGMAEELIALGDARGAVEVVPHGISAPSVAPLPERPSLLFFGRLSRYKGLDTLLDAMPLVWDRRSDVRLTVAGEGPLPDHATLGDARVAVRNEHVPESAVADLFAQCSCVVLPYRQASQSGVGSEAKRFGRAVIATRVGGLPELVTPDVGRLVPPEDPDALAAAILEVVESSGLAAELGDAAAASVEQGDWRAVAAATLAAYRRELL